MSDFSPQQSPPRAWVEINEKHLLHNLEIAKSQSNGEVMAIVKADAYGHGLTRISKLLAKNGVAYLGVANVAEARTIRAAGISMPIYLLGATWSAEREEIVQLDLTPCISTLEEASHFNRIAELTGRTVSVHLAIDTGMGRGGFLASDLTTAINQLIQLSSIEINGIASHYSSSDEDPTFTQSQHLQFMSAIEIAEKVFPIKWRHIANSAAIIGHYNQGCNLTRPGLMLFGIDPTNILGTKLKPVMNLKSRVTLVREVPAGHSISYGHTYVTTKETRTATIGIGYGDGLPRSISGKGCHVEIGGSKYPIIGRVTMDQIIIELPWETTVQSGDEVELFGNNISLKNLSEAAGTIPWEVLTGITPRVTRRYV